MNINEKILDDSLTSRFRHRIVQLRWSSLHLDSTLLFLLILLAGTGLFLLYSASNQNMAMVINQSIRLGLAFGVMLIFAQIPPRRYYQWAPWIFVLCVILLAMVLVVGRVSQGARRWLDIGFIHIQPSEIMKLAAPMMLAWYFSNRRLPPGIIPILVSVVMLIVPALLIIKQPDLGTAIMIMCSGVAVLLFAGIQWRLVITLLLICVMCTPVLWHLLHDYQRERVMTFLNPERDPLGSGYHIIQSKIAIGSGGLFGKGWLNGTQSHLSFLPAHATDFIFAVGGEEFGFLGCIVAMAIFLIIFARCLFIAGQAQSTFARLLVASLSLTFMISALINIGMVIGILPVVGIPLPLISYGGSSMVTLMAGFGIMMSIHTHRKLWAT